MKYYARYTLDDCDMISEKTFKSLTEKMDYSLRDYREFKTFSEAKKWLMEGIQCDLSESKSNMREARALRKKDL